ncbi:hypothetical protein IM076_005173, partial [Escherichia coli]|nr:hypothetical protein [Escherichia coli]EGJ4564162.1 hypothetical protein [Escherichia coli]
NAAQAGKTTIENNAFNLAGRTQKEIESSIQKQVDGVDLDEIYGDDESKKDAYRKGREQGVKDGLKDGSIEVLEGTANSILHPIDTITDLGSAIWNYDRTIDAIKISVTQWNELYEYAKVNDPELAGQMVGSLQGKVLGNLGTSVVVSGAAAKTIQKVAQLKTGAVKANPNEIKRPTPQQSEKDIGKDLGEGWRAQVSFKDGKEVPYGTKGSTRPDWCKGNICSVEVKNYTISTNSNGLINNISKQAIERQQHLPKGMKQEVIIDIRGQKVSAKEQAAIRKSIADKSNGIISISSIRFKTE